MENLNLSVRSFEVEGKVRRLFSVCVAGQGPRERGQEKKTNNKQRKERSGAFYFTLTPTTQSATSLPNTPFVTSFGHPLSQVPNVRVMASSKFFSGGIAQRRHSSASSSGVSSFSGFSSVSSSSQEEVPAISHEPPKMTYPSRCLTELITNLSFEARQKLKNYEFYPNWLCIPNEIILHQNEIDGIVSHLKNTANEMLPRDDSEKQLRTFGMKPIIVNNALAFMMILQNQFNIADDCLTESNRLIDICFNSLKEIIPRDYLTGLFYIVKGLKVVMECHTGTLTDFNYSHFLEEAVEDFEELTLKAQVAVLASKHLFMKLINRRQGQLKYKSIDEIVFLDPDYFEWRIAQYLFCRKRRFETFGAHSLPDYMEIKAIQHAWNFAPFNPFCLAYMCLCLADSLSCRTGENENNALSCGQLEFLCVKDAVKYIKDICLKVIKGNPLSVNINLIVADIFGAALPFKYQDNLQARECTFQAYRCGQNLSSNANFRLGLFMVKNIKASATMNPKLYENLFENAFILDKRNTRALYHLLLVHLHQPSQYYEKIRMLFAQHLSSIDLPLEFVKKLKFLKGCFHFMVGEYEDAITTWMSVYMGYGYENRMERLDFSMLQSYSYVFRVYKWSSEKLNLPLILTETNRFFATLLSSQSEDECDSVFMGNESTSGQFGVIQDDDVELKKIKSILMELLKDQHQALNADEYYREILSNKDKRPATPLHYKISSFFPVQDQGEEDSSVSPTPEIDLEEGLLEFFNNLLEG